MSNQHEIDEVFGRVGAWPEASRRVLVEMIQGTLVAGGEAQPAERPARGLHGLFRTEGPPPSDEDCRRILEEELVRKHLR